MNVLSREEAALELGLPSSEISLYAVTYLQKFEVEMVEFWLPLDGWLRALRLTEALQELGDPDLLDFEELPPEEIMELTGAP